MSFREKSNYWTGLIRRVLALVTVLEITDFCTFSNTFCPLSPSNFRIDVIVILLLLLLLLFYCMLLLYVIICCMCYIPNVYKLYSFIAIWSGSFC